MRSKPDAPKWRPDKPYDDLPPLPPVADLETRAVLKRCVEARSALAGLKRSAELIPNPAMLINTLPLLEAQASSEIENIVTTADALFRHLHGGGGTDAATREALRYREALLEGFRALPKHPISGRTAVLLCSRIKDVGMTIRKESGVALQNVASGEVIYTPPEAGRRLGDLIANWERFVHAKDGLDPLVRMAVAHYQFEAIHPFVDGNGRTGRVLNSLLLVQWGLLSSPILYLSRFIIANKREYYDRLLAVTRDQEWEQWVLYMLRGVEETAHWTSAKIDAIHALQTQTAAHVRAKLPRIYGGELIDVLFEQPYCRIANLVNAKIAGRQAAARYLKSLVAAEVLREQTVGREKLFMNVRLLSLLTRDSNTFEPLPAR